MNTTTKGPIAQMAEEWCAEKTQFPHNMTNETHGAVLAFAAHVDERREKQESQTEEVPMLMSDGWTRVRVSRAAQQPSADAVDARSLAFQLLAASNYIDALGGDSKSYRSALAAASIGKGKVRCQ